MSVQLLLRTLGKTKLKFWERIRDHVKDIQGGDLVSQVARHFAKFHYYSSKGLHLTLLWRELSFVGETMIE